MTTTKTTTKTRMAACLMAVLMLLTAWAGALPASAAAVEPEVMPCWENVSSCQNNFSITANGSASVSVVYYGNSATFSSIRVSVVVQKRVLGIFWSKIDIGDAGEEWVATSGNLSGLLSKTFSIEDTGTYRAKFVVDVTSTSGSVETIEETITATYG